MLSVHMQISVCETWAKRHSDDTLARTDGTLMKCMDVLSLRKAFSTAASMIGESRGTDEDESA
jgi:hypothetical protein